MHLSLILPTATNILCVQAIRCKHFPKEYTSLAFVGQLAQIMSSGAQYVYPVDLTSVTCRRVEIKAVGSTCTRKFVEKTNSVAIAYRDLNITWVYLVVDIYPFKCRSFTDSILKELAPLFQSLFPSTPRFYQA